VNTQKILVVLWNGYHVHRWLSYPLLRFCRSNSDVNIIEDDLIFVEEKHTFRLDPFLFNLKVYSSTFICLKVPTRSAQNLKMQWWLIEDKMLMSSLKRMRCKYLMRLTDLCREGVSQLNYCGYIPISGRRCHIHSFESTY
jgi:hypothetical protein